LLGVVVVVGILVAGVVALSPLADCELGIWLVVCTHLLGVNPIASWDSVTYTNLGKTAVDMQMVK